MKLINFTKEILHMKLKENSRIVYDFVKAHEDENITAKDIAEATGLNSRQVNGIITMAFQRILMSCNIQRQANHCWLKELRNCTPPSRAALSIFGPNDTPPNGVR